MVGPQAQDMNILVGIYMIIVPISKYMKILEPIEGVMLEG